MKKGQTLLIIVFILTFALFSLYMLLSPIKDKLLRIKEMENVYQAVANAEKGLEAASFVIFAVSGEENSNLQELSLKEVQKEPATTTDCGGMSHNGEAGLCYQISYEPNKGNFWNKEENYHVDNFIFITNITSTSTEKIQSSKIVSDGYAGRIVRTIILGTSP